MRGGRKSARRERRPDRQPRSRHGEGVECLHPAARRGRRPAACSSAPQWIEAQQKWRGKSFYPDANSTLRVAIAGRQGLPTARRRVVSTSHHGRRHPREGHRRRSRSTSPTALKKAARNRETSKFFDRKIGDVPVCFLADGDTTGGNSGSPVINGRGELVGPELRPRIRERQRRLRLEQGSLAEHQRRCALRALVPRASRAGPRPDRRDAASDGEAEAVARFAIAWTSPVARPTGKTTCRVRLPELQDRHVRVDLVPVRRAKR